LRIIAGVALVFGVATVAAIDCVRAVAFRSAVTLMIFGLLVWIGRRRELVEVAASDGRPLR